LRYEGLGQDDFARIVLKVHHRTALPHPNTIGKKLAFWSTVGDLWRAQPQLSFFWVVTYYGRPLAPSVELSPALETNEKNNLKIRRTKYQ
jgi:hypothetical protein